MKNRLTRMTVALSALLLLLTTPLLFAGGSTYSRFGAGDLVRYGGGRLDGMGGAGLALTGDGFLNLLNPAGISRISSTRFSGTYEFSNYSSTDEFSSGRFARGDFKGLAFGFPISKEHGIAMLLEATPYSSVNYATQSRDSLLTQDFYGTGGLSQLSIAGSYSPSSDLSLGAQFTYIHGRIRQAVNFTFNDPSFLNSQFDRSDYYSGFNFTVGGIYEGLGKLIGLSAPLAIGGTVSTPTTLSVNRQSILTTSESTDTTATNEGNIDIPLAYGIGFSYLPSERVRINADIYNQLWGDAKFFGSKQPEIRNSSRIGIGIEILPPRETTELLQRMVYRAGVCYQESPYIINGTAVNEYFVTGGVSIPIGPEARLNLGLHVGTRGTTSNGLQRDTILRLTVGISASEAWFMTVEDE